MKKFLLILGAVALLMGCSSSNSGDERPLVVCTTGMIGDAVKSIVEDRLRVKVLMGPGVDPHLYKATQGDIEALTEAEMIIYNGLHLEGKMSGIFEKLKNTRKVVAMGELVSEDQLINSTDFEGAHDPHIWFDVLLWSQAVERLGEELEVQFPELGRDDMYKPGLFTYLEDLEMLDGYTRQRLREIPDSQRVMITAHDAFKYFGKAYGIDVRGLQGISTTSEYGIRDVSDLVGYIVDNKIKAIFVESSVPKRSIEAVIEGASQRGHTLELGGELFSDAMGSQGSAEGTYVGMVTHNVNTITEALK